MKDNIHLSDVSEEKTTYKEHFHAYTFTSVRHYKLPDMKIVHLKDAMVFKEVVTAAKKS